jgi:hypothetical protein
MCVHPLHIGTLQRFAAHEMRHGLCVGVTKNDTLYKARDGENAIQIANCTLSPRHFRIAQTQLLALRTKTREKKFTVRELCEHE